MFKKRFPLKKSLLQIKPIKFRSIYPKVFISKQIRILQDYCENVFTATLTVINAIFEYSPDHLLFCKLLVWILTKKQINQIVIPAIVSGLGYYLLVYFVQAARTLFGPLFLDILLANSSETRKANSKA